MELLYQKEEMEKLANKCGGHVLEDTRRCPYLNCKSRTVSVAMKRRKSILYNSL